MFCLHRVRFCSSPVRFQIQRYAHERKKISGIKPRHFPEVSLLIQRPEYALSYNYRTKNPVWVYEKLTPDNFGDKRRKKKSPFREDVLIDKQFRSTKNDFSQSGFDKGHLAPAGNHKGKNSNHSNTYYLSNISPKNPNLNQGSWVKLEKYVRKLTKIYEKVEVFTGPLFLPREDEIGKRWVIYEVIGKNNIAVPTHFYKILVLNHQKKSQTIEAYILPNQPISKSKSLHSFKTTLEKVEEAAGIRFFPQNNAKKP